MKNILTILFYIVLVCDTYAVATNNKVLEMIFKPLLMPLLVGVYMFVVKKPSFWFLSALFFSFWGDVFLLFEEQYFVFGLGAFLVAHLLYIKLISTFLVKKINFGNFLKSIVPFVLFFSVIIYLTQGNLKEMFIPVIIYGLVISVFGAFTLTNYLQEKSKSNFLLLLGAITFIISDAFIALNVFYNSLEIYQVFIIVLYGIAQYTILEGISRKTHFKC